MAVDQIKTLKMQEIIPLVTEILDSGGSFCLTVTGGSMYPFLRQNHDRVQLSSASFDVISRGDIVLIKRDNGQYILHRVLRKEKDCFYMAGDALQWIEGPLYPRQLIAVVISVWRGERKIEVNNPLWRFMSDLWLRVLPFRYRLIKTSLIMRKLLNR